MSPSRPKKPCAEPGCTELTDRRRCAAHQAEYFRRDAELRGTAAARGYDADHRAWRLEVLRRHPVCVDADRRHPGQRMPALVADHIVSLRTWARDRLLAAAELARVLRDRFGIVALHDQLAPWSIENGQGLCVSCHNAKTAREARRGDTS